ncbi:MAG TPA: sigma-70 family RNA polymerase sigma factor [Polyangiaceae bacterium]
MAPQALLTPPDVAGVVREHAPYVWRALRRLGVSESDVPDVAQEVFVVVFRRLADFEGRSTVRTWIYGICVRTASDYRKRAHRRYELPTDSLAERVAVEDRALAAREARAELDSILSVLDEDKRAVFVLYELEELGMNEVAAALGCPLQTAYSRLHAARAKVTAEARRRREERKEP